MEQTLSDKQRRLIATAVQQANELFFVLELDAQHKARIVFANQYALTVLGVSSLESLDQVLEIFCDPAANPILVEQIQRLHELDHFNYEGLFYPHQGKPFYASWNLFRIQQPDESPILWVVLARDITAQHHEQELRWQRQKIESLSVLAAGIAQDFNNLLAVILGNATMAAGELSNDSPIREMITPIEAAARRAAELTRQMLTYAGQDRLIAQSLQINQIIQEICADLSATIHPNIRFQIYFDTDLPYIIGDSTQIRRALSNVIINAYEALGHAPGTVQISTDVFHMDRASIASTYLAPDVEPGKHIRIVVHNNGPSIQPELLERIFEPFFTTKFIGRGLGLPEALGSVAAHHGTIKIESKLHQGTTCTITFPLILYHTRR
jgi:signal transduction histidine kinase